MVIQTHLFIAEKVNNAIEDILNVKIDKKKFMYGNIKPDLVYRLSKKSHRIKHSLNFVLEEIDNITSSPSISVDQYSVKLGVISHFMSDFFCTPHYYDLDEYRNIINHINYEFKLHYQYKKMSRDKFPEINKYDIYKFKKNNVLDSIKAIEETYSRIKADMTNDILFAVLASTLTCIDTIENSFIFLNEKTAA